MAHEHSNDVAVVGRGADDVGSDHRLDPLVVSLAKGGHYAGVVGRAIVAYVRVDVGASVGSKEAEAVAGGDD